MGLQSVHVDALFRGGYNTFARAWIDFRYIQIMIFKIREISNGERDRHTNFRVLCRPRGLSGTRVRIKIAEYFSFIFYIESTSSIPYCEQKDQARQGELVYIRLDRWRQGIRYTRNPLFFPVRMGGNSYISSVLREKIRPTSSFFITFIRS